MEEFGVILSPTQLSKLRNGHTVQLAAHSFTNQSPVSITVHQGKAKKIMSALRAGRGVRLQLTGDEDIEHMDVKTGGKISLKKIWKSVKPIATPIIKTAVKKGIPLATNMLGTAIGGQQGAQIAKSLNKTIEKEALKLAESQGVIDGAGLYQALSKVGIKKKDAMKTLKTVGKAGLKAGTKAAGKALTKAGMSDAMSKQLTGDMMSLGMTAMDGDMDAVKKQAVGKARGMVKAAAKEQMNRLLDSQLSDEPVIEGGMIYRSPRGMIRGAGVSRIVASTAQTMSPFLPPDSPAMHPVIMPNQVQGYNPLHKPRGRPRKVVVGQGFLPAGARSGRGFMPAGR